MFKGQVQRSDCPPQTRAKHDTAAIFLPTSSSKARDLANNSQASSTYGPNGAPSSIPITSSIADFYSPDSQPSTLLSHAQIFDQL